MKPIRVLFVDDDDLILSTMKRVLRRHVPFADVTPVQSGSTAMALLREGKYDAVICDFDMPLVSGADVLSNVKTEHPELVERFAFFTSSPESAMNVHSIVVDKFDSKALVAFLERAASV